MFDYSRLLHGYKLIDKTDYVFVKTSVKGIYIAYSHNGEVHTSIVIRRNLYNYDKTYYFISEDPMYKIENNLNFEKAPLMDDNELNEMFKEIDFDFKFDE